MTPGKAIRVGVVFYIKTVADFGRGGGGQVVSMLTFYSDDMSFNHSEGYKPFPASFS